MKLKVFYLDDEKVLCDLFSEEFSSNEIQITTFTEAQKILDEVKLNLPDVIFLDYRLPGINGDQVALKMKNDIPKYLISGDLQVKTTYPFVGIFQKPYFEDDLQKVLQDLLEKIKKY